MSGSRIKVAGRFKPCVHMGCFDLDVFVEMNQRSRKASNQIHDFSSPCNLILFSFSDVFTWVLCAAVAMPDLS